MNEQKIEMLLEAVSGLSASEWSRVKQVIDMRFSSVAAKIVLDDVALLKRNLEVEFNLQLFGGKLD